MARWSRPVSTAARALPTAVPHPSRLRAAAGARALTAYWALAAATAACAERTCACSGRRRAARDSASYSS
jgi:hypothetical protein